MMLKLLTSVDIISSIQDKTYHPNYSINTNFSTDQKTKLTNKKKPVWKVKFSISCSNIES